MSDLSWLNPTPHAIAVYASQPLSPVATQHSLPSGRYSLLGPDFHRLDRTSFAWRTHSITSSARASSVMKSRWSDAYCYVAGCGVDCHAMNFQPFGVCVQALRNTSLKLRGWPLISASIAARPVTSAVSPARRTLRSLQVARTGL